MSVVDAKKMVEKWNAAMNSFQNWLKKQQGAT
jgi:hypothetical protein